MLKMRTMLTMHTLASKLLPESSACGVGHQSGRRQMLDSLATAQRPVNMLLACSKLTACWHLYMLVTFHMGI